MELVHLEPGQDGSLLDISSDGDCASGSERQLGYLNDVNELIVRQQWDMRETLRGTEEPNVYFIYDKVTGQKLYHIQEKPDCCKQQCCAGNRGFRVTVYDKFNRAVIEINRPSACCYGGCFPFLGCFSFLDKVTVSLKSYKSLKFEWNVIGYVKQNWNPLFPSFNVLDENGDVDYKLIGPIVTSGCFSKVVFEIKEPRSGRTVGRITKEWSGLCREFTSNTDLFSIEFPAGEIDENIKANLIAAMIFIDYKYFEKCCPNFCTGVCFGPS